MAWEVGVSWGQSSSLEGDRDVCITVNVLHATELHA